MVTFHKFSAVIWWDALGSNLIIELLTSISYSDSVARSKFMELRGRLNYFKVSFAHTVTPNIWLLMESSSPNAAADTQISMLNRHLLWWLWLKKRDNVSNIGIKDSFTQDKMEFFSGNITWENRWVDACESMSVGRWFEALGRCKCGCQYSLYCGHNKQRTQFLFFKYTTFN